LRVTVSVPMEMASSLLPAVESTRDRCNPVAWGAESDIRLVRAIKSVLSDALLTVVTARSSSSQARGIIWIATLWMPPHPFVFGGRDLPEARKSLLLGRVDNSPSRSRPIRDFASDPLPCCCCTARSTTAVAELFRASQQLSLSCI